MWENPPLQKVWPPLLGGREGEREKGGTKKTSDDCVGREREKKENFG
jgi:hypothetical protein